MNYSLFWLLIFQYERKGLFVWHMKAGERKYPFDTLLYPVANRFEWISANEIALGFGDGLMKLWKIDEGTANDSHFEHDVSFKIRKRFTRCHDYYQFFHFGSMVLQLCDHFVFHLMKGGITDLKWNQTTKYLASSSRQLDQGNFPVSYWSAIGKMEDDRNKWWWRHCTLFFFS